MAIGEISVSISAKSKWWITPFLRILWAINCITGYEPDTKKLIDFIVRYGLDLRIDGKKIKAVNRI